MPKFDQKELKRSLIVAALAIVVSSALLIFEHYEWASLCECIQKKGGENIDQTSLGALHVEALKSNHEVYIANVWATMGFLIAAIGWLIQSENARGFIGSNSKIKCVLLCVIAAQAVFHVFVLVEAYLTSCQLMTGDLASAPGARYYQINGLWVIGSSLVNLVFFAALWLLVAQFEISDIKQRNGGESAIES